MLPVMRQYGSKPVQIRPHEGQELDAYKAVTDRILAALDANTVPWRKPWHGGLGTMPRNAVSNRQYNGINVWLLYLTAEDAGYADPRWLTYKQAKDLGGTVRKGEHGTGIIFWSFVDKRVYDNDKGEWVTKGSAILRYYTVFNVEQCDELAKLKPLEGAPEGVEIEPIEAAEAIALAYEDGPTVRHNGGDRAYYQPGTDGITMPQRNQFNTGEEYYSTLFHELAHSTGHKTRLDRFHNAAPFGCEDYSKEELTAEFGSAFLCAEAGIDNSVIDNQTAYIANWRKRLADDPRLLVQAAARGQHAADWVRGRREKQETQAA